MTGGLSPAQRAEQAAANFAALAAFKAEGERREIPRVLAEIHAGRQWLDLGYESWDDACDAVLGGWRLALPREDRREVVAGLRGQGMSTRAIASVVGASQSQVDRDVRASSTDPNGSVEQVTSLDGRVRPATQPPRVDLVPDTEPLPDLPDTIPDHEVPEFLAEHDADPVAEFLDGDPAIRAANLRKDFARWIVAIGQAHLFDAEEIALIYPERADDMARVTASLTKWTSEYERHARQPLRVIQGEAR